jgi:lysozyme
MNLSQLKNSRALWLARERYRYAKWRFYRYKSKRPSVERMALRRKWWALYEQARDQRVNRDRQISAFDARAISKQGIERIVSEEGVVLHGYNDPAGHCTIGVGHLIHRGGCTASELARRLTRAQALQLLDDDLDRFEKAVREAVKVPVGQNEFDAMVSLAFNIGEGGFRGSTVVKRLSVGDRRGAADAFLMWDNPSMLRPRRERERRLFLS